MRLINPEMLTGSNFRFRATATQGAAYVIECSTDLSTWFPLATNSWPWYDVTNSVSGVSLRTYRMRQIP